MALSHSKAKDIGLIFELVSRSLIQRLMQNEDATSLVKICKKHFSESSILAKEYEVYRVLTETRCRNETQAYKLLEEAIKSVKDIDEQELLRNTQKFLADINKIIPLNEFFKQPVSNYRLFASIQQLIGENRKSSGVSSINQRHKLEDHVVSVLTSPKKRNKSLVKKIVEIQEKKISDLTYSIILEQFNQRYKNILPDQKRIVNEYIISMNDKNKFEKFMKRESKIIESKLSKLDDLVSHEPKAMIKMRLIRKNLNKIVNENKAVTHNNLLLLLKSYNLISALKELDTNDKKVI